MKKPRFAIDPDSPLGLYFAARRAHRADWLLEMAFLAIFAIVLLIATQVVDQLEPAQVTFRDYSDYVAMHQEVRAAAQEKNP